MANNTLNKEKNEDKHHHHHQPTTNTSTDQNQDASNLLKLSESFTGGFSPLTVIPVQNRSNAQKDKDRYLSIINNTFKSQNVNIITVSPIPPNHKPLPSTSVHISSMDFGQWRPVSPLNHKSDLFSMFSSSKNRLLSNSSQPNGSNKNGKNSTITSTTVPSNSATSTAKPKSSLKPVNPSLPPKAYTPPTISSPQHIHRPVQQQLNKNTNNFNKNLGHSSTNNNFSPKKNNRTPPMGILNLRNDNSFGHRPSSSNTIQNTAPLPNNLLNNFNLNNFNLNNLKNFNNLNNNNWLLNQNNKPAQLDQNSALFGQPLSDSSLDSMFNFNNFNNPLDSFDEIPSLLRREDNVEPTTIAPPQTFYRESRTNLKNNKNDYVHRNQLSKKEQIDLETLLGLTEFESLKLNSSNSNDFDKQLKNPTHSQPMNKQTNSRPEPNMNNRFQKRIGIVDREFMNDEEYYRPIPSRKPITSTKSSIDTDDKKLINDKNLINEKIIKTSFNQTLTTLPTFNEDLRLNNFNDDLDLTGELPKFNGDGLIEMTTTLLKDDSNDRNQSKTTVFSQTSQQPSTLPMNNIMTTTPSTSNQIECDPINEFACANGKQCIPKTDQCNYQINCLDDGGSDEINCTCADYLSRFNQKRKLCDGLLDCLDASDELHCDYCKLSNSTDKKNSLDDVFICPNAKKCIKKSLVVSF